MRLAYSTGMRRCDCSTNTTAAMITIPPSTTATASSMLWLVAIAAMDCGKRAAIEVKISSDMPLPTPRSVMSSPIHMMRPVPAVMVRTMSTTAHQADSEMMLWHAVALLDPNSAPLRATVMSVVDCSTPRAMVR